MPKILSQELDFIPIKRDFILEKMPTANATFVKIYLYILANSGNEISVKEIAEKLAVIESDVLNAIDYWVKEGVMEKGEDSIAFTMSAKTVAKEKTIKPEPVIIEKQDYAREEILEAVNSKTELKDMLAMAEELLAKPLNSSEMESLYWIYDGLGFSPSAILLLLEYCSSKGKPRISYAEKVAMSWSEKGVITPQEITRYINDSENQNTEEEKVCKALGIVGRSFSSGEKQYYDKWKTEYKMSSEMIVLAYEYCIIQTGKLSFPYMDKILQNWNNSGIFTVDDAEQEHKRHTSLLKEQKTPTDDSYLHNDLEDFSR